MSDKGLRYNDNKTRWTLLDFDAVEGMVKVLEFGSKKYNDHNWKKGLKTTEIVDSMMRHMTAYLNGEQLDKESGLPHVDHIQCNAMYLSYMDKFKPEMDTRFRDPSKRCCGEWDENGRCKCKNV